MGSADHRAQPDFPYQILFVLLILSPHQRADLEVGAPHVRSAGFQTGANAWPMEILVQDARIPDIALQRGKDAKENRLR
jgi:hypothetical protein